MGKDEEGPSAMTQEHAGSLRIPVVFSGEIDVTSRGELDVVDITPQLEKLVSDSQVQEGIACLFVGGSTGALTALEFESGVLEDVKAALGRMAPKGIEYKHHLRWKDANGHSHVRAALIGPSLTVPVRDGRIPLGQWQQVVFIELDTRPRDRKLLVQMIGTT